MFIANKYNKPKSLKDLMQKDFDPAAMGPGFRRGMVLKVYKAKILDLIGCKPNKFYLCAGIVPFTFLPDLSMDFSLQQIDKSGLTDHQKRKAQSFLNDLKGARMSKRNDTDYENPVLYINFKPGSMWRTELHHQRYQLKRIINKRLKCEFIKEVRVK